MHDEGAGFAPEVLEHAFEPFITTKPAGEGTGLGLATVYAIAKSAGGHAEIESRPGRGTTVNLVLPPAESGAPEARRPAEPPPGGEESVLVCEDDERVRSMVVDSLREGGYDEIRRRIREDEPPRPSTRVSRLGDTATDVADRRGTESRNLVRRLRGDLDWITELRGGFNVAVATPALQQLFQLF